MELVERLVRQNPQWKEGSIESVKGLVERDILGEIGKYADDKQMIAIVGLRRTGKTTAIYQQMNRAIKEKGIKPERTLYFSFDEILGRDAEIIEKIIGSYEENILGGELRDCRIFLDEVNHTPQWQVILKRYYDLERNIKFYVSGSSSIFVKRTKESLAGRIYEFELKPLTFPEYLNLKRIAVKAPDIQAQTIKAELQRYMMNGGFPETIWETDLKKIKRYAESIVDKIIFYDIPMVYDVGEPHKLKEMLSIIAKKPGQLIEYRNLAQSVGITYQTASKYADILEKAFLTRTIYNRRGSPHAIQRKAKKIYLTTHTIAAAFLDTEEDLYRIMPQLVENIVQNHTNARYFLRDKHEIDFITDAAIEVKYSENPESKNPAKLAKKHGIKKMTIITKDTEKTETREGMEIEYIPLWKYLLQTPENRA